MKKHSVDYIRNCVEEITGKLSDKQYSMLKQMVKAKTGYISSEQWHKALEVAKSRKAEYQHLREAEQLEYIANIMAVWIINKDMKGVQHE